MKKTLLVIIALFVILGLSLVAYREGALSGATPPSTPGGDTVAKEQIFREVTPSPTPTGEKRFEDVAMTPTPDKDKIIREVTPSPTPVGDPVAGEKIFASACKICHRKDLIHNDFITGTMDQELVEFIKAGGVPNEPLVMLPKGGRPSLTDDKLYDIVAYLRTLQN